MLRARSAKLARAGLSGSKIRTLKAIAKAIDRGELDFPALVAKPADDAHAALTAVHGIGPWTADIYLLFCLGHADAWPAGDLAVQEAARLLLELDARPTAKEMGRSPRRGGRGGARPLTCCGRTIARPSGAKAPRSRRRRPSGGQNA